MFGRFITSTHRNVGKAVMPGPQALFDAAQEEAVPRGQPHAALKRSVNGGVGLGALLVQQVLLEGDGAFAERDLVVKQFPVVCEPLVQRVGHSVKRGREWRVGAMHHSLGCQAQMRPHRGITRRGVIVSGGVFVRQKFVQTVWMRAHPVQHGIGVEGTVYRVAHGAKVTLR